MNNPKEAVLFHRMSPDGDHQYRGILQLLLHFKWTWIGVISQEDDTAERFVDNALPQFSQRGICFDFIEKIQQLTFSSGINEIVEKELQSFAVIGRSTANAVVVHGESETMMVLRIILCFSEFEDMPVKSKVWIMTAQMDFTSHSLQKDWDVDFLHGAMSIAVHSKEMSGFHTFLQMRRPTLEKEDGFIRDFWQEAFNCMFHEGAAERTDEVVCTGKEKLETLPSSVFEMSMTCHSYSIYNAVYAMAHALSTMHSSKLKHGVTIGGGSRKLLNQPLWQVMSSSDINGKHLCRKLPL